MPLRTWTVQCPHSQDTSVALLWHRPCRRGSDVVAADSHHTIRKGGHFRRVLRNHPDLPQGSGQGGTKWFTLDAILVLRSHSSTEGAAGRDYQPWRPAGLPAKVIAVANFKGGVGKTSTAAHLSMSAGLDGYRVIVIDLDSQGSMTSIMGGVVKNERQTAFPLIAKDYARAVQAENSVRLAQGTASLSFDETFTEALTVSARDVIQSTHWPNIDLIGAQLNLYWAEFQVHVWRMALRSWALWDGLTNALTEEGVLDDYDIVLLDMPPALGYLTINARSAADILLVPLGHLSSNLIRRVVFSTCSTAPSPVSRMA